MASPDARMPDVAPPFADGPIESPTPNDEGGGKQEPPPPPDPLAEQKKAAAETINELNANVDAQLSQDEIVGAVYVRPTIDNLHVLKRTENLIEETITAAVGRNFKKVFGQMEFYNQAIPAIRVTADGQSIRLGKPMAFIKNTVDESARCGFVIHAQVLTKVMAELYAVAEVATAQGQGAIDASTGDTNIIMAEEIARLERGKETEKLKNRVLVAFNISPEAVAASITALKDSSYGTPLFLQVGAGDQILIKHELKTVARLQPIKELGGSLVEAFGAFVTNISPEDLQMTQAGNGLLNTILGSGHEACCSSRAPRWPRHDSCDPTS